MGMTMMRQGPDGKGRVGGSMQDPFSFIWSMMMIIDSFRINVFLVYFLMSHVGRISIHILYDSLDDYYMPMDIVVDVDYIVNIMGNY